MPLAEYAEWMPMRVLGFPSKWQMSSEKPLNELLLELLQAVKQENQGSASNGSAHDQFGHSGLDALSRALLCEERSPLVDKALAMLGYNAATICHRTSAFLVDALAALLSTSTYFGDPWHCLCKRSPAASQAGRCESVGSNVAGECECGQHIVTEERVLFGSCISRSCLQQIVKSCKTVIINGHGIVVLPLIEALLKVATESCLFKLAACSLYRLETEQDENVLGVTSLLDILVEHRETLYNKLSPFSRLHAWRLHPMLLKQDISRVVLDALSRPFLSLRQEFDERAEWKKVVICLAMSPHDAFSEARRLLHNWMVSTSLSRLWDVRVELAAAVRGVLGEPLSWGFTDEASACFPPLHSVYHQKHRHVLNVLSGPLTESGLVEILSMVENLDTPQECSSRHDSVWALLVDFPQWFDLALKTLFRAMDTGFDGDASAVAAMYVTLVLRPLDKHLRAEFAEMVVKVADSWKHIYNKLECSRLDSTVNFSSKQLSFKRLKTESREVDMSRESTLFEVKRWIAEVHKLSNASGKEVLLTRRGNILLYMVSLAPVLADPTLLDNEVGRLLVEFVMEGDTPACHSDKTRDGIQPYSSTFGTASCDLTFQNDERIHSTFREPAHRTERFTGGGNDWISGAAVVLNLLIKSEKSFNQDPIARCMVDLIYQWSKHFDENCSSTFRDLQAMFRAWVDDTSSLQDLTREACHTCLRMLESKISSKRLT